MVAASHCHSIKSLEHSMKMSWGFQCNAKLFFKIRSEMALNRMVTSNFFFKSMRWSILHRNNCAAWKNHGEFSFKILEQKKKEDETAVHSRRTELFMPDLRSMLFTIAAQNQQNIQSWIYCCHVNRDSQRIIFWFGVIIFFPPFFVRLIRMDVSKESLIMIRHGVHEIQ